MADVVIKKTKTHVYEAIKAFIEDRKLHPEDRLPTLQQMANRFEVGITAVRRAVARLEAEGLLISRHGSGIYTTGRSTRQLRVGLFGQVEGHLWEDMARELVAALGANPDIILTMIPLYANESHENELARLKHRLRTDGLDVMIAVGLGSYRQHSQTIRHLSNEIKLLEVYNSFSNPNSQPPVRGAVGSVLSDIVTGHGMAMQHLLDTGCKNILLLSFGNAEHLEQACLSQVNPQDNVQVHIRHSSPLRSDYAPNILAYLKEHPTIDGIFGFGDWRIASILPGLRQAGYRVPQDLKLIGYGDTEWTRLVDVPLSTINTLPRELAQTTSRMVQAGLLNQKHVIKPSLIVRQSTVASSATSGVTG